MQNKEYVTFGDDKKGKVKTKGIIKVNEHFISMYVALVEHLKYKLFFVSLVLMMVWKSLFRRNSYRVFDSCGNLVCGFSRCLTH
jgi:hypothetical protein